MRTNRARAGQPHTDRQSTDQFARPKRSRRAFFEALEPRLLFTLPHGAMPGDLAEFMLGSTVVTPVFFESTGAVDTSTEDWTPALIAESKTKIQTALNWWRDTLERFQVCTNQSLNEAQCQALTEQQIDEQVPEHARHQLEFVVDWKYADDPVATVTEPISRSSEDYLLWGGEFLRAAGYAGTQLTFTDDLMAFNQQQRIAHGTNWSVTIFIANSANDPDDEWAPTGIFDRAFAFPQEKLIVQPSGRPASTTTHEFGHMFWALDEYDPAGHYSSTRGYYNARNENAYDNPTPGFLQVNSIMDREAGVPGSRLENAFAEHWSSPSSLRIIGWQDSDRDGIFDVLDVPHTLQGSGYFSPDNNTYRFVGNSSVQTLPNLNPRPVGASSGSLQNDITINRITHVEYRLDGAANSWQRVNQAFGGYTANLNLTIAVPATFSSIEIRTIDATTGVTSPVFLGTRDQPTSVTDSGINGFVRLDADSDGTLDAHETIGISGMTVRLVDTQGQPVVLRQRLDPDDYADNQVLNTVHAGATLTAIGPGVTSSNVLSRVRSPAATGNRVFAHLIEGGSVSAEWTQLDRRLRIDFTDPIGSVSLDAVSNSTSDYGRLEIYDSNDRLLGRYTTKALANGEVETMTLRRAAKDIAYAIASAHLGTAVRLDNLQFGPLTETVTDARGAYFLPLLPPGTYNVELVSKPGVAITTPSRQTVTLGNSALTNIDFGVELTEPVSWQNPLNQYDVDGDGEVAPIDVLLIVSDLNRRGSRELPAIPTPPPYLDVNGDGHVSPVDALLVVSYLNNRSGQGEASGARSLESGFAGGSAEGEASAAWDFAATASPGIQQLAHMPTADLTTVSRHDIEPASPSGPAVRSWLAASMRTQIAVAESLDRGGRLEEILGEIAPPIAAAALSGNQPLSTDAPRGRSKQTTVPS